MRHRPGLSCRGLGFRVRVRVGVRVKVRVRVRVRVGVRVRVKVRVRVVASAWLPGSAKPCEKRSSSLGRAP